MTSTRSRLISAGAAVAALGLVTSCGFLGGGTPSAEVGDCLLSESLSESRISELPTVDCGEPHDLEVFHVYDMADGDYPGFDEAGDLAYEGCLEEFEAYVGVAPEESSLLATPLFPTDEGWERQDREAICILVSPENVTESLRDSGI